MEGWTCPNCGTFNAKGKFCQSCRTQRPTEIPVAEGSKVNVDGWACPNCGTYNAKGKFCQNCRTQKPETVAPADSLVAPTAPVAPAAVGDSDGWACPSCGTYNVKGKFCQNCRTQKPETVASADSVVAPTAPVAPAAVGDGDGWTCPNCGAYNTQGKFCQNCRTKRPEENIPQSDGSQSMPPVVQPTESMDYDGGVDAKKYSNGKIVGIAVGVILLIAAAFFGYTQLGGGYTGKNYTGKVKDVVATTQDIAKTVDAIAKLDGNPEAEATKKIAKELDAAAKKLGELHTDLNKTDVPKEQKVQHRPLLSFVEHNQDIATKAGAVLKGKPVDLPELLNSYKHAVNAMDDTPEVEFDKKDLKSLISYKQLTANLTAFVEKSKKSGGQNALAVTEAVDNPGRNNETLKQEGKMVFLPSMVEKSAGDLLVHGVFYNGADTTALAIGRLTNLEVTLSSKGSVVSNIKQSEYNDDAFKKITLEPKATSAQVTLRLKGQAPAEEFDRSSVKVGTIRVRVK